MTKKDDKKQPKKHVLDLDAIGKEGKSLTLSEMQELRKKDPATLTHFEQGQLTIVNDAAKKALDGLAQQQVYIAKILADGSFSRLAETLATLKFPTFAIQQELEAVARLTKGFDMAALTLKALEPNFTQIAQIQTQAIRQLAPSIELLNKQALANIQPLFDARLFSNFALTEFARQAQGFKSLQIDISTMFGTLQISDTTRFAFERTNASLDAKSLDIGTSAVQTRSNEFVVQERHAKIELILSTTQEQRGILVGLDKRMISLEASLSRLLEQGKQHFSIKDFKYTPSTFILTIKGKAHDITAGRERQLCELLLSTLDAMKKQWSISDMLQLINEYYTTDEFDYPQWVQKYYMAAKRLNARFERLLGMELIIVDKSSETLFVNPRFYHN